MGNFDGVHRGHRAVLDQLQRVGAAHGLPTVDPVRQGVAKIADRLW